MNSTQLVILALVVLCAIVTNAQYYGYGYGYPSYYGGYGYGGYGYGSYGYGYPYYGGYYGGYYGKREAGFGPEKQQ